jgi:hypothetical protein
MKEFACPHCKQQTFSKWDKYLAAKWKILTCSNCKRRVASQPIWLAAFYLLYLADVIDLSFMAYLSGNMLYLVAMVVVWIILDIISLYLPLVAMRDGGGKKQEDTVSDSGRAIGATQSASMSLA